MIRQLRSCALLALGACSTGGETAPARASLPLRDLASGYENTCVVEEGGRIACWGNADTLGFATAGPEDATCAEPFLKESAGAYYWSCLTPYPMFSPLLDGEEFVEVKVRSQVVGLTTDGRLLLFPYTGACTTAPCPVRAEPISGDFTIATFDLFDVGWCGITTEGDAVCGQFGYDPAVGQEVRPPERIAEGHVFTSISVSAFDYVAVDTDGVAWRGQLTGAADVDLRIEFADPQPWTNRRFSAVHVGRRAYSSFVVGTQNYGPTLVCGVDAQDGSVWCDGDNGFGERGIGTYEAPPLGATRVLGLPAADAVAVGFNHVCAASGGDVWCWGLGENGQLGTTPDDRCGYWACSATPAQVPGVSGARRVVAGIQYTCAETADDVLCWGLNQVGRLGGTMYASTDPVAAGL